jgi:hypothetical protein
MVYLENVILFSFAREHVYGLLNHARKGVADWWYSTACFVLKFN